MADQPRSADDVTWRLVAECRREIAAAWEQVEAAREVLRATRWLVDRWREQADAIETRAFGLPGFARARPAPFEWVGAGTGGEAAAATPRGRAS